MKKFIVKAVIFKYRTIISRILLTALRNLDNKGTVIEGETLEGRGDYFVKSLLQEYKGYLTVVVFIVMMGLFTIYGDRGLLHLGRLNQENKQMETANESVREENKALKKEIFLLKNNREYLEETIRKEVGLVRKNEIVYQFNK
ncbi:MAG: septum formation initiator family protein [Proteobacteria bacterium]|nr:septum formation initiator family protein [Pseudomonadota bacterium]